MARLFPNGTTGKTADEEGLAVTDVESIDTERLRELAGLSAKDKKVVQDYWDSLLPGYGPAVVKEHGTPSSEKKSEKKDKPKTDKKDKDEDGKDDKKKDKD